MCRLICAFVVRIWLKQVFPWHSSYIFLRLSLCLQEEHEGNLLHQQQVFQHFHFVTHNLSHVMKKPVDVICEQQRCRSACVDPHSRISTFIVRCLDCIIPIIAKSKISRLQVVSVAEQASSSLTWLQTPVSDNKRSANLSLPFWSQYKIGRFLFNISGWNFNILKKLNCFDVNQPFYLLYQVFIEFRVTG